MSLLERLLSSEAASAGSSAYSASSYSSSTSWSHQEFICVSDLPQLGTQWGEQFQNVLRLACFTCVMLIAQGWLRLDVIKTMPLNFVSWISAFLFVGSQMCMHVMVTNCWAHTSTVWILYFLKFLELYGLNLNSIMGLVFQISVDKVILAQKNNVRVKPWKMRNVCLLSITLAFVFTMSSACVWSVIMLTQGYCWVDSWTKSISYYINYTYTGYHFLIAMIQLVLYGKIASDWHIFVTLMETSTSVRSQFYLSFLSFTTFAINGVCSYGYVSGAFTVSVGMSLFVWSLNLLTCWGQAICFSILLNVYYDSKMAKVKTPSASAGLSFASQAPLKGFGRSLNKKQSVDTVATSTPVITFKKNESHTLKRTESATFKRSESGTLRRGESNTFRDQPKPLLKKTGSYKTLEVQPKGTSRNSVELSSSALGLSSTLGNTLGGSKVLAIQEFSERDALSSL